MVPAYIAQIEVSVVLTEELNREGNKKLLLEGRAHTSATKLQVPYFSIRLL